MKGWKTVPEGGPSYFPCVCGTNVVTMGEYYAHMDFCMTEKREIYLAAQAAKARAEHTIELLDDGDGSWNNTPVPQAMRTGDVPQGERGGTRTLKP